MTHLPPPREGSSRSVAPWASTTARVTYGPRSLVSALAVTCRCRSSGSLSGCNPGRLSDTCTRRVRPLISASRNVPPANGPTDEARVGRHRRSAWRAGSELQGARRLRRLDCRRAPGIFEEQQIAATVLRSTTSPVPSNREWHPGPRRKLHADRVLPGVSEPAVPSNPTTAPRRI